MTRILSFLPAVVAAIGIVVAQAHGGWFWVGLLGSASLGWAVSVMWECASVWLWWRRDAGWPYRLAKWGATCALVGGMIVQGAGPLLLEGSKTAVLESAQAREEKHQQSMTVAMVDQGRKGILPSIDKSLKVSRENDSRQLRALAPERGKLPVPADWKPALAWASVAVFPLLYGVALLAVVTMASGAGGGQPDRRPIRPAGQARNHKNARARWLSGWRGKPGPDALAPMPDAPGTAPHTHSTGQPVTAEASAMIEYGRRHGLDSNRAVAVAIGEKTSTFHDFLKGKSGPDAHAAIMAKLQT